MSRYVKAGGALAASALVAITAALLYGPSAPRAGASRALIDAYCDDGDGGRTTLTLDVRVPAATPADGGWIVPGDGGPIVVRSLDEWADRIERRTNCTLIRESARMDLADANTWPAQAVEVKRRVGQLRCRCLSAALPQTWIQVPCVVHAGWEDIVREHGCLLGANAEVTP